MNQLLVEEQRVEMQNEHTVDLQEDLAEIQTEQQVEVIKAQQEAQDGDEGDKDEPKARQSKKTRGSVATGRGAGRPNRLNTDKWGNRPEGENNWKKWNATH